MLVLAGIALIIIFVTVMVPQLSGFFAEAGGTLPASTKLLLSANDFLTHWWWAILVGLAGLYAAWKAFVRTPAGRLAWDTFIWRVPVYGLVLRYRFYAQFARTLGTLVENGVTLLRALELLEEISGNEVIRLKMAEVRHAVVDGATLSTALAEQQLFPELFVDMMAVGEQTGRFAQTMNNIAEVYERELGRQVGVISTLIPPAIMLAVALVVGFVVFGILSAVFSMTAGLRAGAH
jgi:type II secretory pathway component PulF